MTAQTAVRIKPGKLFIDGKWGDAKSGNRFDVINPATEEVITNVAEAQDLDVDLAVKAAQKAFESGPWPAMSAEERGQILWKLGELILSNADELAHLETLCTGKPISQSRYADIPASAEILQYYAGCANKYHGRTIPVKGNILNYTLREPMGVIAAIIPWNFPLCIACFKIGPALATGNTIVLKPASQTPLTALRLAELAQEAGVPDGVLNIVTGPGEIVGKALASHKEINKITFTGDSITGREIMHFASLGLKRVTLELGGKSPNIVFSDADMERAIKGAFFGIFANMGEICTAGSRLFIEKKIHDEFVAKLVELTQKMAPGDPLDPKTKLGPLVSKAQQEKVMSYIEIGKNEGAYLAVGGKKTKVNGKGYFVEPTIFDKVDNNMKIAQEEIFGPVLSVIVFNDIEEVITKSNDTFYGLAAAIWTNNIKKAHNLAKKLQAGTVWINTYGAFDPASPFGGYKGSGFGRELGLDALETYTQVKSVWVDLN